MCNAHAGSLEDWWDGSAWKDRRTLRRVAELIARLHAPVRLVGWSPGVQEMRDAWPKSLQLSGFTYDDFREASDRGRLRRPSEWYVKWLERDPNYSPGPYEQLASVLRKAGESAKANDILYASREQERKRARWGRFIGLTLLKWTTGYGLGLRYFRSLGWVAGFTGLGVLVLFQFG